MKLQVNRLVRLTVLTVLVLAGLVFPALGANEPEQLPPYDVDGLEHTKIWAPWVFAFLFAVGCLLVAFKNPHRSTTERD
jgi:hypothetical protein